MITTAKHEGIAIVTDHMAEYFSAYRRSGVDSDGSIDYLATCTVCVLHGHLNGLAAVKGAHLDMRIRSCNAQLF